MRALALVVIILAAPPAFARGVERFYNPQGLYQGSLSKKGDTWTQRDKYGLTHGYFRRNGNQIEHYNSEGLMTGHSEWHSR